MSVGAINKFCTYIYRTMILCNMYIYNIHTLLKGYFFGVFFFRFAFNFWFPASLLFSFSAFPCFFASPLSTAGLLFCFSAFSCFSTFLFLCLSASPLFCFSLLFCFFASLLSAFCFPAFPCFSFVSHTVN